MEKNFYVHPHALCESDTIGDRTRVWAFSHVMKGATIGADCNLGDHSFVESGVTLGDRVTVKNGVAIWEGVTVEDDVFLGPNCVLTNDLMPRSRVWHDHVAKTMIRRGASVGANATIVAGNTLGEYCLVGAGSVVTRDVPAYAVVIGVPAKQVGWAGRKGEKLTFNDGAEFATADGTYRLEEGAVSFQPSAVVAEMSDGAEATS